MSEAPATSTPAATESSAAATTPTTAPTPTPPAVAAPAVTANVWENPEAAKAEIERLRKENGAERVNAKAQAADEARKEVTQSIAKALGLVEDDANDPVKLTASLTAAQAAARQSQVELAVFRNAATAGGDPAALLDSSSFLASLATVDPSDTAAVAAAIQSAIAANPRLGAAPADPKAPAPNPAQGSSASGSGTPAQLTEQDVNRLAAAGKHEEIVKAKAEGRLATYLGQS